MLHKRKFYLLPCALIIIRYGHIGALQQMDNRFISKKQSPLVDPGLFIGGQDVARGVL
jgi:hypothetical protein